MMQIQAPLATGGVAMHRLEDREHAQSPGRDVRWVDVSGTEHELKSWPEFFEPLVAGLRTFDLRRSDDRTFSPGDTIRFREFDPRTQRYTGRECRGEITYVTSASHPCALSGEGLDGNFCILAVRLISRDARQ